MIPLYNFNHLFKEDMLEITPDVEVGYIWKYLLPMSTEIMRLCVYNLHFLILFLCYIGNNAYICSKLC